MNSIASSPISENRRRRGVFTSVPELTAAIEQYVAHHNAGEKSRIKAGFSAHYFHISSIIE
jgi:hypothetical protein